MVSLVRAIFTEERALAWLGVAGLALAAACAGAIAFRGVAVPPEGDLMKPLTFNLAVGMYTLTLAALLPLAGFSPRGRRVWRWWTFIQTAYSYAIETIQSFRGLDPRFTRAGTMVDQLLSAVFGLVSLALIGLFLLLAWRFFRIRPPAPRPLLILGIRYGMVASLLAYAAGLWMIALQGRHVGSAGNLLPLHALGFHGLQAVPLAAWLWERAAAHGSSARRWVHLSGMAWLGACVTVAGHTYLGRPVTEFSPGPAVAGILLLIWAAACGQAALAWRQNSPVRA